MAATTSNLAKKEGRNVCSENGIDESEERPGGGGTDAHGARIIRTERGRNLHDQWWQSEIEFRVTKFTIH